MAVPPPPPPPHQPHNTLPQPYRPWPPVMPLPGRVWRILNPRHWPRGGTNGHGVSW